MIYKLFQHISAVFLILFLSLNKSFAFDLSAFFKIQKRSYIYVVGSSTVSPLMTAVSEEFSRDQSLNNKVIITPVVEANGTAEGFRLFCAGVGYQYPDFANASQLIGENEIKQCNHNGVKEIVPIKIGYDGIVIGNSVKGKKIKLTKEQIFLALAQKVFDAKSKKLIDNPYKKWSEIDPALPPVKITVYGPPLTSGTRDVFVGIVMEDACFKKKEFIKIYENQDLRKKQCRTLRNDGVFVESGENDNLIIENLKNNPEALGIFGFNFLVANKKVIQAVKIEGVEPTFASISSKKYEFSRPLFVYFKKEHLKLIPYMREFILEIINPETIGNKGYLANSGLIPLSNYELEKITKDVLLEL
jgi:phosphate transport system substrate-binding protein